MNMDFGNYLKKSWDKLSPDLTAWVVFGLVAVVLTCTVVLIPTVARGLTKASLDYIRKGQKPELSLLWDFEGYVQFLLFIVVAGVLLSIGYTLLVIPGILLGIIWMYSTFFMADKNLGFWEAMTASKDLVLKTGFWNHLILNIILGVINSVGASLCGLGIIITLPFSMIMLTYVYTDLQGENLP